MSMSARSKQVVGRTMNFTARDVADNAPVKRHVNIEDVADEAVAELEDVLIRLADR